MLITNEKDVRALKAAASDELWFKVISASGKSHHDGEFEWPLAAGGVVIEPFFEDDEECGNGLHGWPMENLDECDFNTVDWGEGALILVFKPIRPTEIFDGKAKCMGAVIESVSNFKAFVLKYPRAFLGIRTFVLEGDATDECLGNFQDYMGPSLKARAEKLVD